MLTREDPCIEYGIGWGIGFLSKYGYRAFCQSNRALALEGYGFTQGREEGLRYC